MKGQALIHDERFSRRQAMMTAMATVAAGCLPGIGMEPSVEDRRRPFLLSQQGSGRATGYAEANKIVTANQRTHVAWLDSTSDGFRVRIRTLDRQAGAWSPTYTVGHSSDNHGGPALTVDSRGFLHIVYYPHHDAMHYRKSKRPGDASEWEAETTFGQRLTYPTLMCQKDDTLLLTARRSFSDQPWRVEIWKRPAGEGTWQGPDAVLASRYPGYSHFQESLAWGPDHRTLHLCCRFHEKSDGDSYGRLQTVAYLVSPDAGRSWQRSDGSKVRLPATAESADVIASGGVDQDRILRAGAMAVDPSGRPYVVYSVQQQGQSQLVVACHSAGNRCRR